MRGRYTTQATTSTPALGVVRGPGSGRRRRRRNCDRSGRVSTKPRSLQPAPGRRSQPDSGGRRSARRSPARERGTTGCSVSSLIRNPAKSERIVDHNTWGRVRASSDKRHSGRACAEAASWRSVPHSGGRAQRGALMPASTCARCCVDDALGYPNILRSTESQDSAFFRGGQHSAMVACSGRRRPGWC